jgi:hypothetical protein
MNALAKNKIAFAAAVAVFCMQLVWDPFVASTLAAPPPNWQSVHGSAEVQVQPPFGSPYRLAIAASRSSDGQVIGTLEANGDLGTPEVWNVVARIDCLAFDGNSVWFGAVVVVSPNLPAAVGAQVIGQIKQINGVDYAFVGPAVFFPGKTCADKPFMPLAPVQNGNYTIQ